MHGTNTWPSLKCVSGTLRAEKQKREPTDKTETEAKPRFFREPNRNRTEIHNVETAHHWIKPYIYIYTLNLNLRLGRGYRSNIGRCFLVATTLVEPCTIDTVLCVDGMLIRHHINTVVNGRILFISILVPKNLTVC